MTTAHRSSLVLTLCALALSACHDPAPAASPTPSTAAAAVEWPHVTSAVAPDPKIEARIAELLSKLTLEQKVAQMVQPDIRWASPDDVRKYKVGSILNGGGAWRRTTGTPPSRTG